MSFIEEALQKQFLLHHPEEAAPILENYNYQKSAQLIVQYPAEKMAIIFEKMSPDIAANIITITDETYVAQLMTQLHCFYACNILARLPTKKRTAILEKMPEKIKNHLNKALAYPQDTAGSLMESDFIALPGKTSVSEAIWHLQKVATAKSRRVIFIVDDGFHLQKMVDLQTLVLANHSALLNEIATPIVAYVTITDSQEKVVDIFEKYRITDLPVVDYDERLLGLIPYDILVESSKEEATTDILTMVGVSKDERALSSATFAVKKRLPWLQINLLTAFLAASVVGLFENTIATYTVLAVLLPIVAGQSGNTGSQALAVTIRGLALREIYPQQSLYILFKEARVGLFNGIAVALTTSLGVYVWSRSLGLCLIIGSSMILSMFIASIAGAAVPLILGALKQDPAQSSSVILTTITDVTGFFSFLGIATLLSSLLV